MSSIIQLLIWLFGCLLVVESLDKIRIRGKWFVDETDRVVLFHGVNVVSKQPPWLPDASTNQLDLGNRTQIDYLKQWGFNVVRLGLMWSGLMPRRDYVNRTYLNEMIKVVDRLEQAGIYVIIDLHQDMISTKFGSYDGAPRWLIDLMPDSKFAFPWPLQNQTLNTSLFAAYVTESCGFAFQCLYKNVNLFGYYFQLYWTIVSKAFANRKSILGYELLNEPWAGDIYANPLLLLPGVAGHFNLLPLYDQAYKTIRQYDSTTLIFFEPVTWGVLFDQNYFGTGFNRPPGNDPQTTVLSWHYYCWLLQFTPNPLVNGTYPMFKRVICDDLQIHLSFGSIKLDMLQLGGGPSFLTEFGVCAYSKYVNGTPYVMDECEALTDATDAYLQSWAYWDSNFFDSYTGQVNDEIVNVFSRVYPMAVNGEPILLRYNTTTKEFLFKYEQNVTSLSQAKQNTEIYVPPQVYERGFGVNCSIHLDWSYDRSNNRVLVFLADRVIKRFYTKKNYHFSKRSRVKLYSL